MKLKKLIRKHTPSQESIRHQSRTIGFIHRWLLDSNLWHLNRRSVATGFAVGLFSAFLPIPAQMLLAIVLCILFHGHVALAVAATWITNPFTAAPIAFFCYQVGAWILGYPPKNTEPLNYSSLMREFSYLWRPFLLGSLLNGLVLATSSYIVIRVYWRNQVLKIWRKRKAKRLAKKRHDD